MVRAKRPSRPGINDENVPPSDAAKMAARLQAATISGRPVLLRVDWQAGHAVPQGLPERTPFCSGNSGIRTFSGGSRSPFIEDPQVGGDTLGPCNGAPLIGTGRIIDYSGSSGDARAS
jgi:hypothetical protein